MTFFMLLTALVLISMHHLTGQFEESEWHFRFEFYGWNYYFEKCTLVLSSWARHACSVH
jgi:hypothetical protein